MVTGVSLNWFFKLSLFFYFVIGISFSSFADQESVLKNLSAPEFIGPAHQLEEIEFVKWAAVHDRRPSIIIQKADKIFLANGRSIHFPLKETDGIKPSTLIGKKVVIQEIGAVSILYTDSGQGEISPFVARLFQQTEKFLDSNQWFMARVTTNKAIRWSQDLDELLSIADRINHPKILSALRECYSRAIDLSDSTDEIYRVAAHASQHGAEEDAALAYRSAFFFNSRDSVYTFNLKIADQAVSSVNFFRDNGFRRSTTGATGFSPWGSTGCLTQNDYELYRKLDRAFRDPETNYSLVESDLLSLLNTKSKKNPLFAMDAQGRRVIDLLCHYLDQPIQKIDELRSLEKANLINLDLKREIIADVIHTLAHLPGSGVDNHAIFQGFGTSNCVAVVTLAQLVRLHPVEYTQLALSLFFNGSAMLADGTRLDRNIYFEKDRDGRAQLHGRTSLEAVLQDSLMRYTFNRSGEKISSKKPLENIGFTSCQINLIQNAVLGGNRSVICVDSKKVGPNLWKQFQEKINHYILNQSEVPVIRMAAISEQAYPKLTKHAVDHPIPLSIKNHRGGFHFLMIAGYIRDSSQALKGYLLMDPEGFRYFYSLDELAELVHEVVLPSSTTLSVTKNM